MTIGSEKKENPFYNILFNIVLPAIVLSKFSKPERLGPELGLLIGLAFPLFYGVFDFLKRKKANFFSILGFVSILLTGSFGLMALDGIWFAVKEGAIPLLIGVATIVSLKTQSPFVKTMLFNEQIMDVSLVEKELAQRGNTEAFEKLLLLTTWLLAGSFLLSAILNFVLALVILKSPAGSAEFNEELGKMTALSYPVIVLPSLIVTMATLWYLVRGIKQLTGLELELIFKTQEKR